jgi:hypothetical protein
MNKIMQRLLGVAALAALSTGLGLAQEGDKLRVSIPFAFAVGSKLLQAGDYTIISGGGSAAVVIRDARYQARLMTLSIAGDQPARGGNSQLVFRVHGGRYYLASTWNAVAGTGREFPETRAERQVEVAAGPTTYTTLIAAK